MKKNMDIRPKEIDKKDVEKLELPGEMTHIRYIMESAKFVDARINELKEQKTKLLQEMKQRKAQIDQTIESAEAGYKHLMGILKIVKKAGSKKK